MGSVLAWSCGLLLCLGLSISAQAEQMKGGQPERKSGPTVQNEMREQNQWGHFIHGDVVRVEQGNYFVKDKNGKTLRLETDHTSQVMGEFKKGDRVLARVTDQHYALSIIPAP
jgi:hypothetical protein